MLRQAGVLLAALCVWTDEENIFALFLYFSYLARRRCYARMLSIRDKFEVAVRMAPAVDRGSQWFRGRAVSRKKSMHSHCVALVSCVSASAEGLLVSSTALLWRGLYVSCLVLNVVWFRIVS